MLQSYSPIFVIGGFTVSHNDRLEVAQSNQAFSEQFTPEQPTLFSNAFVIGFDECFPL
jgi:hypothetical protein